MDQLQPAGVEKESALRQAGFNDQEIDQWKTDTTSQLMGAGFSTPEVDNYFGAKNPDMKPIKGVFKQNEEKAALSEPQPAEGAPPKPAKSFVEAIEAGWDMSVSGLLKDKPHTVLPEDAPMFYRIASQVSQLAGDVPAMLAGGTLAGAAIAPIAAATGPVAGPIVEAAGAGYGSFALPATVRKVLMDHYEKGDVHDFQDFWERSAAAFIEGQKQGFVGAATVGVGGVAGKVLSPIASVGIKTSAQLVSEVATMTTLGKAVEGQVPQPQDFIDGAILVGGLHGAVHVAGKLRSTYAATGVKPSDVAEKSMTDPLVRQDLVTQNITDIPEKLAKENGVPVNQELGQTVSGPANKEVSGAAPVRTEAETKILSQVGEKVDKVGDKYTARSAYKDFVDKLDPISEAVKALTPSGEKLPTDQNPYDLARMANDYKSKAKFAIEKGPVDFKTLETVGDKGLKQILEPFKDDPAGFESYLISKRALEVEGKGLKSGFDQEAAKQVVADGKDKYEQAAKELYDFKDKNLEYLKDSGVIGEKEFEKMTEANASHVSFSRILDEKTSGAGGKSLGFLKEFKGSESKIQSPILSTLENTESIFKAAEKNRAVARMVDLAMATKDQEIMKKVDKPRGKLGPEQFEVFRDGEREVYEAPKELAEAIKSLSGDPAATNIFIKMARAITGVKRLSISLTPDFVVKNFFRDQLTAGAFSKGGSMPFLDAAVAMKDITGKSDAYYNWLKSGGAGGSFLELNKNYLENNIFELNKETGIIDKAWNVVKKPVQFLEMAGQLAENATRLAEFKKVSQGESAGPKVFAGGMAAREVTVDFTRIGAKLSAYNAITAFMNVSVQGLDRTVRAIKEDPKGVTAKAMAGITVPSVLLWYANKDDERYKQLPRWQKDTFWIIPTDSWQEAAQGEAEGLPDYLIRQNANGKTEINKGTIYRIPKPQELGILFGALPERLLEKFFTDNPAAMKDFEGTVQNMVTPSFVPDAIAPFIEQKYNKSLFTDSKIVPGYLESVAPEYQYTEYTSESAKQLAKMIKWMPHTPGDLSIASPQVLDNYVRSWSGNLGSYVLRIADEALYKTGVAKEPIKPAWSVADVPVVKAFVIRYPSASAQSIQDLYTNYAAQKETMSTIKHLAGTQEFDALQVELDKIGNGENVFMKLDGIKDALSKQSQVIHIINRNDDYTRDEKRQLIDGIYYGMIETAKTGNDMLYQMEKLAKEMKDKGH